MASAQDIRVDLRQRDAQYVVEIVIISRDIVTINHDMSEDPVLGSLHFRVFKGAEELGMRGDIHANMPSAKSYVSLFPGQYFGGVFDADLFQKMYGMTTGCYSVEVAYLDPTARKFHGYAKEVTSNRLKVCLH